MSRMLSFTTPPGRRPATVPGRAAAEPTPSRRFPLRASCRRAGTAGPSRSPSGRGCPSPRNATAAPPSATSRRRDARSPLRRNPVRMGPPSRKIPTAAIAGPPGRFRRAVLLGPGQSKYAARSGGALVRLNKVRASRPAAKAAATAGDARRPGRHRGAPCAGQFKTASRVVARARFLAPGDGAQTPERSGAVRPRPGPTTRVARAANRAQSGCCCRTCV